MNELIKLQSQTINGNAVETVNARELHEFLESKRQFADWIKNRISEYDFIENQDFVRFHKKMKAKERYEFVEKPRLCDFFRKFGKRSPTPRIRPHPRQDFSTWIKKRIGDYDFVENKDFVKLHKKVELSKSRRTTWLTK